MKNRPVHKRKLRATYESLKAKDHSNNVSKPNQKNKEQNILTQM